MTAIPEPLLPEKMEFREDEGTGAVMGTFHRLTPAAYLAHPSFFPSINDFDWEVDPTWDVVVIMDSDPGWVEMPHWEGEGWYAVGAIKPHVGEEE